jgi:2-C-methyl-D-erythritol 2,4-cyclodiphosphate synthase
METRMRTGIGFDVHRLQKGRPLWLGGVEIPAEKGLMGHSDADVLIHAICDAVLGAAGKGDIGEHFPDEDPAYKDIRSCILLGRVAELVRDDGWTVVNVDAVVVAEKPKISPYKSQMRFRIAEAMNIAEDRVSIKATTTEGLGLVGREEGIAAFATVLLGPADAAEKRQEREPEESDF